MTTDQTPNSDSQTEPPQIAQIRAWVAGDHHPEHDTYSFGKGYAEALLEKWDRLVDLAEVKYELAITSTGQELYDHMKGRIDKLYMALNARARGDENDADGDPADPAEPWNRLVGATAQCAAYAIANGRWAVAEHRSADKLREALGVVVERMACDHVPRLGVDFDPECGRCQWMHPVRRALSDSQQSATPAEAPTSTVGPDPGGLST